MWVRYYNTLQWYYWVMNNNHSSSRLHPHMHYRSVQIRYGIGICNISIGNHIKRSGHILLHRIMLQIAKVWVDYQHTYDLYINCYPPQPDWRWKSLESQFSSILLVLDKISTNSFSHSTSDCVLTILYFQQKWGYYLITERSYHFHLYYLFIRSWKINLMFNGPSRVTIWAK